jgi:hypothetical protein
MATGWSFADALLNGTATEVKTVSRSYWRNAVSIRNHTHRLIVEQDKSGKPQVPELYDIRNTPDPVDNIAESNPQLVQQLRRHLNP